jgi:hypothetical protein
MRRMCLHIWKQRLNLSSIPDDAALRTSSTFVRRVQYFDLMYVNAEIADTILQKTREHELPILTQPDIHFWRLTKSHTYLHSERPTEESNYLTVRVALLELWVRGILFSLMVRWKGALRNRFFFSISQWVEKYFSNWVSNVVRWLRIRFLITAKPN